MRLIAVSLAAALLLAATGCAGVSTEQSIGFEAPLVDSRASSGGLDLSITLAQADLGTDTTYELAVDVDVLGHEPVELKLPNGSLADVKVTSVDSGALVISSTELDREAIASQPQGFEPDTSVTLSDGSGQSVLYQFSLEPGTYELTGSTFDPAVEVEPVRFEIR